MLVKYFVNVACLAGKVADIELGKHIMEIKPIQHGYGLHGGKRTKLYQTPW